MDYKQIAKETLQTLKQGYYLYEGKKIDISQLHNYSIQNSLLITPETGRKMAEKRLDSKNSSVHICVKNISSVEAVLSFASQKKEHIAILNFASAKNPGGGFINGAMAQEESIAASSGLYETLLPHKTYYESNRSCKTMMYTDYAIYSPQVVFFRNGKFAFIEKPAVASVLTLPAVNMGQVYLKNEDPVKAKNVMKERMRLALSIFAAKADKNLILGAYGCGVFKNDPREVAQWWKDLLAEGYGAYFNEIIFAVLDTSKNKKCISAFQQVLEGSQYDRK